MIPGLYSCNIVTTGANDASISILETNVIVTARSVSNDVVSNPVEIPFRPALFYQKDLVLDEDSYSADLVIVGTEAVLGEVTVSILVQIYFSISCILLHTGNSHG